MNENYTTKELERLLEILESDCIDDSEEILIDFGCKGPALIREVLEYRHKRG